MKKWICLSAILAFLTIACAGPEKLLSDTSAERIYFGKSGGFTNIPMSYVLIDNSYIFRVEKDNYIPVRKLNRKEVIAINQQREEANLEKLTLNEPGNMTYYIRVVKESFEKEIKWTDTSTNEQVKDLYKALIITVNP
jgi:hypothetical protein